MEGGKEEDRLPPGFRFHPTDEELIAHYLTNKMTEPSFGARAIAEVDINKCEPWDLPGRAKMGEKEWYFFTLRDRKYPTGVRTNRATEAGYWKTTGKDKEIFSSSSSTSELVGLKKTLVFYKGRAPRGEKTNWVMHEYRIYSKSPFWGNDKVRDSTALLGFAPWVTATVILRLPQDEWVVCRVFMKSSGGKRYPSSQPRATTNTMMHSLIQNDPFHLVTARSYLSDAELMELSRFARGNHGTNLPIQPQLNFHGGGFPLAGLNLNLIAPTPAPQGVADLPASVVPNGGIGGVDGAFGTDMSSMITGLRYHNVDSCVALIDEGYWPSY
ncbi:hypothetical protein GW17_00009582 [Ensete ventricosum]|nr:hypothetical protein GW17_00009582 [Ensete ventricosum]